MIGAQIDEGDVTGGELSAEELARAWLEAPVGQVPLLPDEMARLRGRIRDDEAAKASWDQTCAIADAFLAEEPGPLTPTPRAAYRNDNPQATVNNNRAGRFGAGWAACAWKAALTGDAAALDRAAECLDMIVRVHREKGGIQLVPDSADPPSVCYYHAICSFTPEYIIVLVELMRLAGYANAEVLAGLVERLVYLAGLAGEGCDYLHGLDAPYWNAVICNGTGLLAISAVLPDHPGAAHWEEVGWRNLAEYFGEKSVLPDGSFHEAFPCGEEYGLGFLMSTLEILRGRKGLDVSTLRLSPIRTLKDAVQWHMDVASPLGELPCINDTNAYDRGLAPALLVMGQWTGLPEVWKALRAEDYRQPLHIHARWPDVLPEGRSESVLFPDVGWSFIRSGQGREAFQAMFDHGLHQTGHCMPHCLTFDLVCHGHHWVVNSGCAPHYCTYDEQNTWHRRTVAGNCVAIDGEDIPKGTDGELLDWAHEGDRTTVRARHSGYGEVAHERTLVHRGPGSLLVIDRLVPTDGRTHSGQMYWHINGLARTREYGRWVFDAEGDLSLALLSDALEPETAVRKGLCGGLSRRNQDPGRLPSLEAVEPGGPGWPWVPYLALDLTIPPEGRTVVTAFVALRGGGEEDWGLEVSDGRATVSRKGQVVLWQEAHGQTIELQGAAPQCDS